MISKGEQRYWSTGITVRFFDRSGPDGNGRPSGWGAHLNFYDDGFCDDETDQRAVSTEGTLRTRYFVADGEQVSGLSMAIDALLVDAARLGIEFRGTTDDRPYLYYEGDGEDPNWPPPLEWRALLAAEAVRIGWAES